MPSENFSATPSTIPVGVRWCEEDECAPIIPALVTKLLSRQEVRGNPRAIQAIAEEGRALVDAGTWLEDTVIEKDQLIARARATGERIHYGDLMSICSVKFFECQEEAHRYKGRIWFRGDSMGP